MKNRIITLTFIFFLLTSFLLCQIKKDDLISEKERRRLASKPKISITSLLNGNYFNKLDTYVTDQIPFRDEFKTIKGNTLKKTMFMKENNGIYEKDNILYQIDTKVNVKSIRHLLDKISYIDKTYLTSQNKYFVYIPDKNYYLNDTKDKEVYLYNGSLLTSKIDVSRNVRFGLGITKDLKIISGNGSKIAPYIVEGKDA